MRTEEYYPTLTETLGKFRMRKYQLFNPGNVLNLVHCRNSGEYHVCLQLEIDESALEREVAIRKVSEMVYTTDLYNTLDAQSMQSRVLH